MTRRDIAVFTAALLVMGAGWGATQPLAKIAVSDGYGHFGLIFWQLVIAAVVLGAVSLIRGKRFPLGRAQLAVCVIIALIGTVIPNSASYQAIRHLPAGIISILLSIIPMLAFPVALALGLEIFNWRRLLGLMVGICGVLILVLPDASLPDPAMLVWIPLALVAPLCYAFEGNYVAKWGTAGLDPIQTLFGASVIGAIIALPLAVTSDQFIAPWFPWSAPDYALVGASLIHAVVYTSYVWIVGRAGSVFFSAQVSYPVTGFGVFCSMLILSETYSPFIWASLGLILIGVFLVQPRSKDALAEDAA